MARSPYQVLVIPFRRAADGGYEFAAFKRADEGCWQFIAGGGEGDEKPIEAAKREAMEEAGIPDTTKYYPLDTVASVPVVNFAAHREWPDDLYVVRERSYAVEVLGYELVISREHEEFKWLDFDECSALLEWDSNRNALWELDQRLANGDLPEPE